MKIGIDQRTDKKFAIKYIQKNIPALENQIENILKEYQCLSEFNHFNIVQTMDMEMNGVLTKSNGDKINVFYLVLELVSGGPLFQYIRISENFSEKVARFYFHQIVTAIEYIHEKGIVHRELKAENILLDDKFNIKLTDFRNYSPIAGGVFSSSAGSER
jgi:serine/threonine protein kinase